MAMEDTKSKGITSSCQWNFVNAISHPRELKNATNISTIRRTAMRATHRVKRQNVAKQTLAQMDLTGGLLCIQRENNSKVQHHTTLRPRRKQPPVQSDSYAIDRGALQDDGKDNQDSRRCLLRFPIGRSSALRYSVNMEYPGQEYLLDHWTSVIAPILIPVCTTHNPMSSIWLRNAFEDPLLMCATLLHAAVHLDMIHKRRPSRLSLHLGVEAARLMNLRLNSGNLYLEDTSIAAVAMMLGNQIFTRNAVEMKIHLNALERIIEMKGGLNMLGMDGVLEMAVKWVDIPISIFQNTRPRFLRAAPSKCLVELIVSNLPATVPQSFDVQECSKTKITTALFYLRREIRFLTETWYCLIACPSRTSTAEGLKYAARRASLEQILLLAGQGNSIIHDTDKCLRQACCIAGSIYISTVLRVFQPRPPVSQKTLTRRLMACVERYEVEDEGETGTIPISSSHALFWALSVGATASLDREETTWYTLRLTRAVEQLGLRSWGQAVSILNNFLWEKKLDNDAWKSISASIQESLVIG